MLLSDLRTRLALDLGRLGRAFEMGATKIVLVGRRELLSASRDRGLLQLGKRVMSVGARPVVPCLGLGTIHASEGTT